ncbi:MAG: aldo/keto reductase [Methylobacteriaceae bacterium]|nr:aldo/keto reductase [Methylobacteriaceae bacterium]
MTSAPPIAAPVRRALTTRGGAHLAFTELGFGTAPLGNLYRPLTEAGARATLEAAWETGCRYFDTAPLYGLGLAETRLNGFLRDKRGTPATLSSKVGRLLSLCPPQERAGQGFYFDTPSRRETYDYSHDGVLRSLEASLERLGVDAIDILFVHDIDVANHGARASVDAHVATLMGGGYRALERLRAEGVIKAFGAGVNEWQVCEQLLRAGDFDIFLLAGRYTLLEQEALTSFLPLCQERGVGVAIGGPFNSGILASGARPGAHYDYRPAPPDILARVARLEAVCAAHGVGLAEAALRFPLAHPCVVSVIPGAQTPEEARRNAATLAARIPAALWRDLKSEGLMRADAPTPAEDEPC